MHQHRWRMLVSFVIGAICVHPATATAQGTAPEILQTVTEAKLREILKGEGQVTSIAPDLVKVNMRLWPTIDIAVQLAPDGLLLMTTFERPPRQRRSA